MLILGNSPLMSSTTSSFITSLDGSRASQNWLDYRWQGVKNLVERFDTDRSWWSSPVQIIEYETVFVTT